MALVETHNQHSQKLMQCVISLEVEATRSNAKMELIAIESDLMPAGKPTYLDVIKYPKISQLVAQYDKKTLRKVLYLMLKNFCSSLNVKYNMSEDQIIEAAAMLLDECGDFRLEDYQMMFALAKRGQLVDVMHSVDISVISKMLDEYWLRRHKAAETHRENELKAIDKLSEKPTGQMLIEAPKGVYTFADVAAKFLKEQEENAAAIEEAKLAATYKAKQEWARQATAQGVNVEEIIKQFSKK